MTCFGRVAPCIGLMVAMLASLKLVAQEQGAGRGPRRLNTREFLGLGPAPDAAAAKKGEPLFAANCAGCHGKTARGGQGPDLVRSVVVLHDEKDETIGPVIKNGRPEAGMPPFPQLPAEDIHNISQFLKMQVELTANRGTYGKTYSSERAKTSGDMRKGQEFFEANCVSCHSATGDLAAIGAKFPQAATMQARFIWPVSMGPTEATVTKKSGQEVTGTLLKLNDFDVELRDSNGQFQYWPRDLVDVKVEDKLGGHRALLPKYTDADLHNVTAYLMTLK
ncbi:MAG TPA: c-type cytochrome [Bryobacteraceae bacterium]|jgi:mono/diheme cytochrome c family protein|nr:c-type cytochrome [Bryobacteraceae bacterium]